MTCDNDSSKGVSDYCEPHRREKERQLMDDMGFRTWYNDQPYKGERLAFNSWQASKKKTALECIKVIEGCGITIFHIDGQIKMQRQIVKAIKEKFGIEI